MQLVQQLHQTAHRSRPSSVAGELAQKLGDGLGSALGRVLIAHGGHRSGVTQPGHQLGQRGTRQRRQHRPGMSQVVEAKVRTASHLAGGVEVSVQGGRCQVTAVLGRKQ